MNFNYNDKLPQIIGIILLIISIKMFIDHRRGDYVGPYNPSGSYDNVTAVKHDLTKVFTVELFTMLILGLASGQKLYDPKNMLNSWLGKTMVMVTGFFVFHEFVQPYIINSIPNF